MNRRRVMKSITLSLVLPLAGCQGDYPDGQTLSIQDISANSKNDRWNGEITIVNDNVSDDSSADFHNVTILGYGDGKEVLCRKTVGDVSYERDINNGQKATIVCPERPDMLTFKSDKGPCDEERFIEVAVYSTETDRWILGRHLRECGEGLPPNPSTKTS